MINRHHVFRHRNTLLAVCISLWFLRVWGLADARQEIAFPDIPGYITLKCDFHMHTVFSDGQVWPDVRVNEAWREGLDVIAISDHIEYQPHKDDIPKNLNRPYEIASPRAEELGILLVKGAEITFPTPPGHFNALFVQDITALETKEITDEIKNAHQQGGFVFWNHPAWQGREKGQWTDLYTGLVQEGLMNGIEICNGNSYDPLAHQWCMEKNLTMLGNTDTHGPSSRINSTDKNHRTLTLVFAKERSLAAVKEALQNRRSAVWCEDKLIGKREFLEPLFYASVVVHKPHKAEKSQIWIHITNNSEITLALERTGKAGPQKITLAARKTTLLTMPVSQENFLYTVKNFLITPESGLPVGIEIPGTLSPEKKAE